MTGRSPTEEAVVAAVENLGVPYEAIELDPAFADTRAFCEKYGYPVEQSCGEFSLAADCTDYPDQSV